MRKVTCKDCGRQYDYDKDDFCPKCGSYNPPGSGNSTRVEQELLSRFDGGRKSQARGKEQAAARQVQARTPAARQAPAQGRTVPQGQYKPHGVGAATEAGRKHGSSIRGCAACEEPVPRGHGKAVVLLLLLAAVAAAALVAAWNAGVFQPKPEIPSEPLLLSHAVGEAFSMNDTQVTVDDVWQVDLSGSKFGREGYACVVLDMWIEGGTRRDDLAFATPMLELADGTRIPCDDARELTRALKDYGVYDVTLSDCQWEDPLDGQFVFFVPLDAGGQASLVLEEYVKGTKDDPALLSVHSIALNLPWEGV